ncbi:MAG: NlpC/P60 family protein, partial [Verrucomicrobiales bacterium]|nr:NlpC/P60 family protein [Verrucomicrobiales bacterium]
PVVAKPAPVARYERPQTSTRISTPVVPPSTYPPAQITPPETYHSAAPSVNRYPAQPMVQATPVSPGIGSPMVHSPDCPLNHGNLNSTSVARLREVANEISRQGIPFRFGRSHPAFGGLDSSGAVQYLLNELGVPGVPRTTGGLHSWVRVNDQIREFDYRPSVGELATCLVPGNLVFWGDQYSGRLTHVMIYLGYDARRDRHLAFGTRGGTEVGINGSEVDIFTLKLDREKIVATGRIPGL